MSSEVEKNKIRGKKARASGAAFEKKVRTDLESKGFTCDRWTNNVEFTIDFKESVEGLLQIVGVPMGKLIPAKAKIRMGKQGPILMNQFTGFPDFIILFGTTSTGANDDMLYKAYGIECKSDGYLDKEEKLKCRWLLENNIFSKILIARKGKERGKIEYKEVGND